MYSPFGSVSPESGFEYLNHCVADLKSGGILRVTPVPISFDVRAIFTLHLSDGELLARVWESGLSGCQGVPYLEAVLREYRDWKLGKEVGSWPWSASGVEGWAKSPMA